MTDLLAVAASLEHDQLEAIAEAVRANRSVQRDEVHAIRREVFRALVLDGRLVSRYGELQRRLTGLELAQEQWPHAEACEALGDALLAALAPHCLSPEQRAVLEWPWVSVCGPISSVASA